MHKAAEQKDDRLAEALVKYQMTLLGAMNTVNDKIENGDEVSTSADHATPKPVEVDDLARKLAKVESGEEQLKSEFNYLASELKGFSTKLKHNAVSPSHGHCR